MSDPITRLNAALEGRYRIERELGEGGMATVYLADDLRHERKVALKVLKPELAAVVGADRFLAEIKTTANLQHPHILPLFDSGEADSFLFYVMPYVDGESLRERLDRKHQLPVDEAVKIASDVAEALQAAHEQGVIHRDVKPANILLSKGRPLVSDFGIALALGAAGAGRLTETGLSLGTPHYMSPEQATGDVSVGAASDIYALGCVLYEMLVGSPPFVGSTPQAVLGKIVTGEAPSASAERKSVPPNVDAAIRKTLEKVPADRFLSASSFAAALADGSFRLASGAAGESTAVSGVGLWRAATVALLLLASGVALLHFTEAQAVRQPLHLTVPLPPGARDSGGLLFQYGLSPDGRYFAVAGVIDTLAGTFVRALGGDEWRFLPGTNTADFAWSPDSRSIAFFDNQALKLVSLDGGPVREITSLEGSDFFRASASWGSTGVIVLSPPSQGALLSVPASGGEAVPLTVVEPGERHRWPSFLPDGQRFLFTSDGGSMPGIYVASLEDPTGRRVLPDVSSAVFAPADSGNEDGYLIFLRDDRLMAQAFDVDALTLVGETLSLAERALLSDNGRVAASVGDGGILTYLGGGNRETDSRLTWFDRSGNLLEVEREAGVAAPVSLAPDERVAAFLSRLQSADVGDVWLHGVERGSDTPLTYDGSVPATSNVIWSPDGRRVAFTSKTAEGVGLYLSDVSEPGSARLLLQNDNEKTVTDWTSGGLLLYTEQNPNGGADLWYVSVDEDQIRPVPIREDLFDTSFGTVSPDGRWIAYVSNETGVYTVWVQPFPSGIGRWPVSASRFQTGTTQQPRWIRDTQELVYFTGAGQGSIMVAPLLETREPNESPIGTPRPLFPVMVNTYAPIWGTYFFDVSADGERFLVNGVDTGAEPEVHVWVNWMDALRQNMGGN